MIRSGLTRSCGRRWTGTGPFEGQDPLVRRQGAQKGIQNQIMVAWTLHELDAALAKADAGDFDPAEGALHNWDEAWAFYHGVAPDCAPHLTANRRSENFGTGTAVNDAILVAMIGPPSAPAHPVTQAASQAACPWSERLETHCSAHCGACVSNCSMTASCSAGSVSIAQKTWSTPTDRA